MRGQGISGCDITPKAQEPSGTQPNERLRRRDALTGRCHSKSHTGTSLLNDISTRDWWGNRQATDIYAQTTNDTALTVTRVHGDKHTEPVIPTLAIARTAS